MLSAAQRKFLRAQAHNLKPVVITGAGGLHPGVLAEIDSSLAHHELIKVRLNAADRETRIALADQIVAATGSELVQIIGHVGVFFRSAESPVLPLPRK